MMQTLSEALAKCIPIPQLVSIGIAVGCYLFAFILYLTLLFLARKLFRQTRQLGRKLIESLKYPALVVLLEFATVAGFNTFCLPDFFREIFDRASVIVIILTIGWITGVMVRTLFLHATGKLKRQVEENHERRSILTQLLFLYRISMFAIVVVTLAVVLMTFPYIKSVGIGILGSAGIVGIALGIAARPILLNIMAGFQIAFSKTIKIGDAVFIENDFARIESLHLTHVVARTWDLRRIILPVSYFIDKPFQNWDSQDPELLGTVFLYCDYSVPVDMVRKKAGEIIEGSSFWNQKFWNLRVTNLTEKSMELRIIMTANDAAAAFELRCHLREELLDFLKIEYPEAFPCIRIKEMVAEQ